MRRLLIGCGGLAVVGVVLVVLVAVIAGVSGGPAPSSSGQDEGEQKNEAPKQKADSVTVRLSGTQGIPFSGSYGTASEGQTSVDGTLGAQPTDYEVPIKSGALDFDLISTTFQKRADGGSLKVQILVDGEVKKEQETTASFGAVSTTYSPAQD